ncbi:MAG: SUMF1/EgtB/PvdO family nonheme iron enzyme [Polyangiaceae bacterium]
MYDEITCDPESHVLPNGGLKEGPGTDGCPPGMLGVDTFCVDRFEASLETLDGEPWSPYFNPGDEPVIARSIEGVVPQGYITGVQAAAACANAGKRLCTDEEWLRACQGPQKTTYPYGDTVLPGVCNDARSVHPAIEYFGTSDDWIWSELGNACISQLPESLDRTGENPGCITAEGAFDMMGNLHEWTADPAGTFRGGFYVDTKANGPGCLYKTTAHDVVHWDYSTGFRCCADAP